MPQLIRFNADTKPQIVTITDGFASLDFVVRGALTLAEDAHFLARLEPAGGANASNQDVWLAAIMTLIVMRQDLMQELTKLPSDPIPLDAKPEDILGPVDQLSIQFTSRCFDLYLAEKQSTPIDERSKAIAPKPSIGQKRSTTSK